MSGGSILEWIKIQQGPKPGVEVRIYGLNWACIVKYEACWAHWAQWNSQTLNLPETKKEKDVANLLLPNLSLKFLPQNPPA